MAPMRGDLESVTSRSRSPREMAFRGTWIAVQAKMMKNTHPQNEKSFIKSEKRIASVMTSPMTCQMVIWIGISANRHEKKKLLPKGAAQTSKTSVSRCIRRYVRSVDKI